MAESSKMIREVCDGAKRTLKEAIPEGLRQRLQPRRFLAFGIGGPKSGTTALAGMFGAHYRSDHEGEWASIIRALHDLHIGATDEAAFMRYLARRDRRLWLEMEASCFLGFHHDLLARTFPEAKYILTIRDARSWLDSILNNNLTHPPRNDPHIAMWHAMFFRPSEFTYSRNDEPLRVQGLYPLDAYLTYWRTSNGSILDRRSGPNLLVLRTEDIDNTGPARMGAFLGVPASTLLPEEKSANRAPTKHRALEQLDPTFLEDKLAEHCGALMDRIFGEGASPTS